MESSPTNSIISQAKAIILRPAEEWPRIAADDTTTRDVFLRYIVPLAAIGPLAGFIGAQVFGYSVIGGGPFGVTVRQSVGGALVGMVVAFMLTLISFMALALIADFLSPKFGGAMSNEKAFKLVAYSSTPVWLVGIFTLVPSLSPLTILALYSLYLLYSGVGPMLNVPKEKVLPFTVVLVVCGLLLNIVVGMLSVANLEMLREMGLLSEGGPASVTVTMPDGASMEVR